MRRIAVASLVLICLLLPLLAWGQSDDALSVAAKQVTDRFVQSSQAKRGQVAEIDGPTLYVSLGSGDGILEGQLLQIAAKGDPIVVDGETLGYKEKPVAVAEVATVQGERLCLATVKRTVPGQQPAKGNLAYLKPAPPTLAISSFLRQDNAPTAMGQEFADKLAMALQATGRFRIVERTRLDAALSELKLGLNDLFDPAKTARLGQMIQARGVVMGTITQQNDRYTINVRVVDIETGTQVLTAVVTCGRSDELDRKYGQAGPAGGGGGITTHPGVTKSLFDEGLKWLADMDPSFHTRDDVLVGGKIMLGPQTTNRRECALYLGDGNWRSLSAEVGIPDAARYEESILVTFSSETRPLKTVVVQPNEKPQRFSVDLTGVETLRITFNRNAGLVYWSNDACISDAPAAPE